MMMDLRNHLVIGEKYQEIAILSEMKLSGGKSNGN